MKSISRDIGIKYKSEIVPRIGILDILEYNINGHIIAPIYIKIGTNIRYNIYNSLKTAWENEKHKK